MRYYRVSLPVEKSPLREKRTAGPSGPLVLPRAAAATLVIRARSPRDDRSVCVVHVPDPAFDGSAGHVRAPSVLETACSPIRFCCFAQQLVGGGATPAAGAAQREPLDKRARCPFWHGQGEPTLNHLQGPA